MKLKYSPEFKLEAVQYQLSGHSRVEAAKKFNINPSTAIHWLELYQCKGEANLHETTKYAEFDEEFKLKVVLAIINDGLSLREAQKDYNLKSKTVITNWLRQYEKYGITGLKPKKHRGQSLKKTAQLAPEQAKIDKEKSQDELLDEIAYLRAEVAFLKKQRALRLESEKTVPQPLSKSSQN